MHIGLRVTHLDIVASKHRDRGAKPMYRKVDAFYEYLQMINNETHGVVLRNNNKPQTIGSTFCQEPKAA